MVCYTMVFVVKGFLILGFYHIGVKEGNCMFKLTLVQVIKIAK